MRTIAFVLPLAYWPLTYDHYVLPKLLVARFAVLALAILLVTRIAMSGRLTVKRTPLDLPLLALFASAVLSALLGVNQNIAIFGTYARYDGVLTLCTYVALFWLTVQALQRIVDARALLRALIASGFVVAVIAIIQWIGDAASGQRAYGTMGNANVLGAFLVLLCPAAYIELLSAKSAVARVLAGNALVAMLLALLLTVSRSSWIGLGVAIAILLIGRQLPAMRNRLLQAATVVLVLGAAALAPVGLEHGTTNAGAVSSVETVSNRLHVWQDTIPLIAERALVGYGPDTFGLTYPRFQSGNWGNYAQFDKAHSEVLQLAATQGLIGVAIYMWLLASFALLFWRGPRPPMAWGLLASWIGYQVVLQFNFTALSAALPFWIFTAAAVVIFSKGEATSVAVPGPPPLNRIGGFVAAGGLVLLAVPALAMPYLADVRLKQAVDEVIAGDRATAAAFAVEARRLASQESVYAVEAGNIAFERHDWVEAEEAYSAAAALGSFDPRMYRYLAITEQQLGKMDEARAAAHAAVYLNRFDPVNQALLAQMNSGRP